MLYCLSSTDAPWSVIRCHPAQSCPAAGGTGKDNSIVLGRCATKADIALDDPIVPMLLSRRHCRLQLRPDGLLQVEDLASLNGTFVDGPLLNGHKQVQKLQPNVPAVLQAGDTLMLGGRDTVLGLNNQLVNNPFKFLVSTACADVVLAAPAAGQQTTAAVASAVAGPTARAAAEAAAGHPVQAQQGSLQAETAESLLEQQQQQRQHQQRQQDRHQQRQLEAQQAHHQHGLGQPPQRAHQREQQHLPQHMQQHGATNTAADQHREQGVLQESMIHNMQQQQHGSRQTTGQAFLASALLQGQPTAVVSIGEPPAKRHRGASMPPAAKPDSWQLQHQAKPLATPLSQPLPQGQSAAAAAVAAAAAAAAATAAAPASAATAAGSGVLNAEGVGCSIPETVASLPGAAAAVAVPDVGRRRTTPQRAAAAAAARRAAAAATEAAAAGGDPPLHSATAAATAVARPGAELAQQAAAGAGDTGVTAAAAAAAAAGVPHVTPPSVRRSTRVRPPSSSSKDERRVRAANFECTICRELMVASHGLDCGHVFCGPCLAQWLEMQAQPSCPTCRTAVERAPVRMYGMDCILDDAALKSGSEPQELAARKEAWDAVKDDIAARWHDMFDGSSKRAKKAKRPTAAAAAGVVRGGASSRGRGTGRAQQQQRAEPVQLQEGDRHLLSGLRHPAAAAAAAAATGPAAGTPAAAQPRQRSSRRRGRSAPQQQQRPAAAQQRPTAVQQRPAAAQQRAAAAGRAAGVAGASGQQQTISFARLGQQGPSTAQGQSRPLRQTAIDALFC